MIVPIDSFRQCRSSIIVGDSTLPVPSATIAPCSIFKTCPTASRSAETSHRPHGIHRRRRDARRSLYRSCTTSSSAATFSAICIGARCNIQDATIIHTNRGVPLDHRRRRRHRSSRAIVHCRSVGPHALIGMGSIILDDCEIGAGCIIAAGASSLPSTMVPDGKLVMGVARQNRPQCERRRAALHPRSHQATRTSAAPRRSAGPYPSRASWHGGS